MVELNQQLLLLSAIGADQEHCPMVLEAAPSTCETDLSLDAHYYYYCYYYSSMSAQLASSASTCARCAPRGRGAVRRHPFLMASAPQAAVPACRQAGALEEASPAPPR